MSRDTAFPARLQVCPAKTQISLHIRTVWRESSQGAMCVAKDQKHLQANSEDSDQPVGIWASTDNACNPGGNAVSRL